MLCVCLPAALAADYTFVKIADSSPESNLWFFGSRIAINNQGVVSFSALERDGGETPGETVILTGSGGPLTRIASTAGPLSSIGPASINNLGTVVFGAVLDNNTTALYTGSGGALTSVATSTVQDLDPFGVHASINDQGAITYVLGNGRRLVRFAGGTTRTLSDATDPRFANGLITPAQLNNGGTAAFLSGDGSSSGRGGNLYRDFNGHITSLLDNNPLRGVQTLPSNTPSINDAGDIVFTGVRYATEPSRYVVAKWSSGQVTDLVALNDVIFSPQINNSGSIAFYRLKGSSDGFIQTGPDAVADKVIGVGDSLFGSTVRIITVPAGPGRYFNDRGQIAFMYQLPSGVVGIAVATPRTAGPRPALHQGQAVVSSFMGRSGFSSNTYVEIYGTNLASTTRTWTGSDFNGAVAPVSLDGVSVTINGKPAAVYYVSPTQINVNTPDDDTTGPVTVQVTTASGTSDAVTVTRVRLSPTLHTVPQFAKDGRQYVVAQTPDFQSFIGPPNLIAGAAFRSARPGEIVSIYALGCGPTTPPTRAGVVSPQNASLSLPFQVRIGGVLARVPFAGIVANTIGLYQFNVEIPTIAAGDHAIELTVDGFGNQQDLRITVGQ